MLFQDKDRVTTAGGSLSCLPLVFTSFQSPVGSCDLRSKGHEPLIENHSIFNQLEISIMGGFQGVERRGDLTDLQNFF
jgi:hypothetical protein